MLTKKYENYIQIQIECVKSSYSYYTNTNLRKNYLINIQQRSLKYFLHLKTCKQVHPDSIEVAYLLLFLYNIAY